MQWIKLFNRGNGIETRIWTNLYRLFLGALGQNSVLSHAEQLLNPRYIYIGERVLLAHDARLDAIREYAGQPYGGEIHIGNDTIIQPRAHIAAAAKLLVGKHVLIASNVYITDHDHGFAQLDISVARQPLAVAPTRIEDFVWLGENVVVLKGVVIGHHAIVGANSVVTRDVPPNVIAGGVPTRVIRNRAAEEAIS